MYSDGLTPFRLHVEVMESSTAAVLPLSRSPGSTNVFSYGKLCIEGTVQSL